MPYAVSFQSGSQTFILVTLHVVYGEAPRTASESWLPSPSGCATGRDEARTSTTTSSPCKASVGEHRIAYEHYPEPAPTTVLRQLQYAEDDRRGVGKRSRRELAAEYIRRYTTGITAANLTTLPPTTIDGLAQIFTFSKARENVQPVDGVGLPAAIAPDKQGEVAQR